MEIKLGNMKLSLIPLMRNMLQITSDPAAALAPLEKEFYHYDTDNGTVSGQIEASLSDRKIAVHMYFSDIEITLSDGNAAVSCKPARFYSLSAASNHASKLNGGKYSKSSGTTLSSPVIFADTCWGIRLLDDDAVIDLTDTESGNVTFGFSDNINFVIYTGKIFEMLALDRKLAGNGIIPAVTDYAPNSGAASETVLPCDSELIARHSVHYDCFSDITRGPLDGGFYSKLRYRLIPYIYSQIIESRINGMPLVRPLSFVYYDPDSMDAENEYMFGRDLLIASEGKIWLPLGENWMNWNTGRCYTGGQYIEEKIPDGMDGLIYVRGGAAIPMSKFDDRIEYSSELILREVPGGCDSFWFYETDGNQHDIADVKMNKTLITAYQDEKGFLVRMGERYGRNDWMSQKRTWIAEMAQCVEVTGTYVNCRDRDHTVREDGITVCECGEPWLINIRFKKK